MTISNRVLSGLGVAAALLLWFSGLFSAWLLCLAAAVVIIGFLAAQLTPTFTRPILIATAVIIVVALGVEAFRTSFFTNEDDRFSYTALGNSELEADMVWAEGIDPHARELRGRLATKCRNTETEVTEQIDKRMQAINAKNFLRPAQVKRVRRQITRLQEFRALCREAIVQSEAPEEVTPAVSASSGASITGWIPAFSFAWPSMLVLTGIVFLVWWFLPRGSATAGITKLAGFALLVLLVAQGWQHVLPEYWKDALARRGLTTSLHAVTAIDSPTAPARDYIRDRCEARLQEKTEALKVTYPTLSDEAALEEAGKELAKIESFGYECGALVAPRVTPQLAESVPSQAIFPIAVAVGLILVLLLAALWGRGSALGTTVSAMLIIAAMGVIFYYVSMRVSSPEIALPELNMAEFEETALNAPQWGIVSVTFRIPPHKHVGEFQIGRLKLTLKDAKIGGKNYKFIAQGPAPRNEQLYAGPSASLPSGTARMFLTNDGNEPMKVTLRFQKHTV
ncbi:MAG: hypothetical protein AAB367_01370 [Patescibacteria group bacterium]